MTLAIGLSDVYEAIEIRDCAVGVLGYSLEIRAMNSLVPSLIKIMGTGMQDIICITAMLVLRTRWV